ncbi:MAG TPA: alpha/beta fold hydrolase [Rhizomicrobium sp.]|nr:alpha/beta fold hydrolase [Rhizomicrobium sp.]
MSDAAILPPKGSPLGLGSASREAGAFWACVFHPPAFPREVPRGDGHTVLVIPGFLAGDWTTARMRNFLRTIGYRTHTARVAFNAGPTPGMLARLDETLLALSRSGRISLVGQSLGGILARSLAARHTGHVRGVVTLGSPIRFPVTTPLQPFAQMLTPFQDKAWLGDLGHVAAPPGVPVTAIYSEEDGIVDWRQCLQDEDAMCRNVRVSGAHATMGSNPEAQAAMARALSALCG